MFWCHFGKTKFFVENWTFTTFPHQKVPVREICCSGTFSAKDHEISRHMAQNATFCAEVARLPTELPSQAKNLPYPNRLCRGVGKIADYGFFPWNAHCIQFDSVLPIFPENFFSAQTPRNTGSIFGPGGGPYRVDGVPCAYRARHSKPLVRLCRWAELAFFSPGASLPYDTCTQTP